MLECIDSLDDLLCLGFAHRGADREGELGAVYLLGDGQRQMGILSVAFLPMGRDGVVDESLDAVFLEVLLQAVALVAEDGEEVVDVMLGADVAWQADERVGYTVIIKFGDSGAVAIVVIEVGQLGDEHGGLQLIDAAVVAGVAEHVLLGRAVVAQGTHRSCQLVIVGGDAPGITQCTEVLAGVEAVACGVAEGTGLSELTIDNWQLTIIVLMFFVF